MKTAYRYALAFSAATFITAGLTMAVFVMHGPGVLAGIMLLLLFSYLWLSVTFWMA